MTHEETIFIRSTRTRYLSLEEHIDKIDSHIADNLKKLANARLHGHNTKKWMHKIMLLTKARNEVMLQIDARSA